MSAERFEIYCDDVFHQGANPVVDHATIVTRGDRFYVFWSNPLTAATRLLGDRPIVDTTTIDRLEQLEGRTNFRTRRTIACGGGCRRHPVVRRTERLTELVRKLHTAGASRLPLSYLER